MFFGTFALKYGEGKAGFPSFMEQSGGRPAAADAGLWDPAKDTCDQGERRPGAKDQYCVLLARGTTTPPGWHTLVRTMGLQQR